MHLFRHTHSPTFRPLRRRRFAFPLCLTVRVGTARVAFAVKQLGGAVVMHSDVTRRAHLTLKTCR